MASASSYDVLVKPSLIDKNSRKFAEIKRLAKRANSAAGNDKRNFAVIWLPGGKSAIRFFSAAAAAAFRKSVPDDVLA